MNTNVEEGFINPSVYISCVSCENYECVYVDRYKPCWTEREERVVDENDKNKNNKPVII